MTSKCKHATAPKQLRLSVLGISALLALCAMASNSVRAQQNDGADIPPPPQLKQQTHQSAPDTDFHSPMHSNEFRRPLPAGDDNPAAGGRLGQYVEGEGPGARDGMSEGGAYNGGGRRRRGMPGGPGFGEPGMGRRGMRGGGFEQGFEGGRGFPPSRRGGGGFGMPIGRGLDLTPLNLTEEQKQRIKQLREGNRDKAKDLRKVLMQKQEQLKSMIFSPEATDTQIRAMRKEVRKAQDAMEELTLNDLLQVRGVLTAEQKQKLPQIAPQSMGPANADASLSQQRHPPIK